MSNPTKNQSSKSIFNLDDKVALITGAASGIGKEIAESLGELGAKLILSDIDQNRLNSVSTGLTEKGIDVLPLPMNLADKNAIDPFAQQALFWKGKVDILITCAAIEGHVGSLLEVEDEDWNDLLTLNLQSALWLSRAFAPSMIEQGSGRIIFISSIAGLRGNKAIGLYGIAKAGLSQMARNLAVELGPNGITVNAIAPGLIETPFSKPLIANQDFIEKRLANTPLRRVGQPSEIAGIAAMLAGPAGGFITGQTIVADGGTIISDGN